jgi:lantibiotic modifying enzyme
VLPEAASLAQGAAQMVARGARWIGPTQCHGLAGNIEFLLDMYQETNDQVYLTEAQSLARLLEAFASERENGLVWPSDDPAVFAPDYMVGYAGVASCLLRLADPERRPHGLSRADFGYRS